MSIQDELLRKQKAEGSLMAQNTGATTTPLVEEPMPISGALPNSGSAGSGGNATEGRTPVPQAANESQTAEPDLIKDRGDPTTMIDNMPMGQLEETLERSAKSVANGAPNTEGALADPQMEELKVKGQKLQMNKAMAGQGANPETALKSLRDKRLKDYAAMRKKGEITPEQHTGLKNRWKNIFNIVPKEDMGLFLMDFGFRAMMAGETMGSAGAIGAAGAGALAGSQGRRQAKVDAEISDYDKATEGALAERTAATKADETINTEQGIYRWDADKGEYVAMKDEEGGALMPSTLAGRPSVKQWEMSAWKEAYPNWTKQEITNAAMSGVTPQQARDTALRLYMQELGDGGVQVPGKGYVRKRDLKTADKDAYIEEHVRRQGYTSGGALPDSGTNDEGIYTTNPGWSPSEWRTYQEATGQIQE